MDDQLRDEQDATWPPPSTESSPPPSPGRYPADEKRGWGALKWLLFAEALMLTPVLSFTPLAHFLDPISWLAWCCFYAGILVGVVSLLLACMASWTRGGKLAIALGLAFVAVDAVLWFIAVLISSQPSRH